MNSHNWPFRLSNHTILPLGFPTMYNLTPPVKILGKGSYLKYHAKNGNFSLLCVVSDKAKRLWSIPEEKYLHSGSTQVRANWCKISRQ